MPRLPPYLQRYSMFNLTCLSKLSDCPQYQLNARDRTLSPAYHNLNQRVESNQH